MFKFFKPTKAEEENYPKIDKLLQEIRDNDSWDDTLMRWVAIISLIIIFSTFFIVYLIK